MKLEKIYIARAAKIWVVLWTLLGVGLAQNICSGCVDINYNNFTCNNLGCQGFRLTPTENSALNFGSVNCLNQNGGCYYTSKSPIASRSFYIYLFCNYTFPGCSSCSNDQTCSNCQNGFFPNVYNAPLELANCVPCQDYIGGCETCYTSYLCNQCNPQYLNIFGLCYTQTGSIVGSTSKPWNRFGSTPT